MLQHYVWKPHTECAAQLAAEAAWNVRQHITHRRFNFNLSLTFQFGFISLFYHKKNGEVAKMKRTFVKRFLNFSAACRELDKKKMPISWIFFMNDSITARRTFTLLSGWGQHNQQVHSFLIEMRHWGNPSNKLASWDLAKLRGRQSDSHSFLFSNLFHFIF